MGEEKNSFSFEIVLYNFFAAFLGFLQDLLNKADWRMSPARGYLTIFKIVEWFRSRDLWHFGSPAFLYVMEQMEARAEQLSGTYDDEKRSMEMTMWRDRPAPIPGHPYKSILQIFDWFMSMFRRCESMMEYYHDNAARMGEHEITEYEAWDLVFGFVDKCSKDPHFGYQGGRGHEPFPWVKFIRDEMYDMKMILKPGTPPIDPGYEPPFSAPGQ
jgi:hypothetical protein